MAVVSRKSAKKGKSRQSKRLRAESSASDQNDEEGGQNQRLELFEENDLILDSANSTRQKD